MKQSICVAITLAAVLFLSLDPTLAQRGPNYRKAFANDAGIYCTGFIAEFSPRPELQVIGGELENEVHAFSQGEVVYLNKGRAWGVKSGGVYSIIRPQGEFRHPFTREKMGYFVREVGLLRVIETHELISIAEILVSCDRVELGDVLRPYELDSGPETEDGTPLPRYSEGSTGLVGQLVMSPIFNEYLTANQLVFIDLGERVGVRPGDHFTIYRKVTKHEGIVSAPTDDIVQEKSDGFGSKRFRGGNFASGSSRVKRAEVLRERPPLPRKVMGELVVLKVEKNSAVAIITRTTAEVNIGDFVERVKPVADHTRP